MTRLQTRAAPADAAPTAGRRQLRLLPSGSGRARGGGPPGSGASDGRRWLVLAVATAIGLILTGSAVFLAYSFDAQLAHVQFGALAESRRLEAQEGLTDREQMMQAICGLVEFSKPGIGRAAFNALIDELLPPSYGVDSVSWIPRVPGADRALVLEAAPASDGGSPSALRYAWQAPDVPIKVEPAYFAGLPPDPPDLAARLAPLRTGQVVAAGFSGASGGLRDLLDRLKIRSLLLVAIVVKGRYWGHIGFHDCRREREWSAAETDALKTLAELVGSVIERARYVDALADADAIVRNSPTFLFRLRGETPAPLTYVSPNVSRIIGYDAARLLAQPTFYRTLVHPDDRATVDEALRGLIDADAGPAVFAFRVRVADGAYRWFENRATAHRDEGGGHLVIEGLMSDVTERRAAERKIAELARTDPLTGLANRTSFRDRLGLAFAAARRGAPGFAVLCLDLDHFKDVNDTLGHPAGDKLLQAVAERIAGSLRETDLAARFGGDEFVVLQTDVTDPSVAGALAQRIRGNLAASVAIDGSEVHIAASVGIALYTAEVRAPEDLLEQADRALYRAKEDGRGRYRFHSEKLDAVVHEQIAMAGELRTAIAGGQLEIYYQPQVAVQSGAVVGMEALVRWNHPQRGLLEPAAFLPAAERAGMIVPLGKWVLEHACRQLRLWRDEGLTPPVMAVNLSGAQLKLGREFERDVAAVLEKWRLSPGDLEFDVSESVLLDATRGHPDALAALRQLGVGIAIDDFGSDYTAIGRLRASHVKRFKIAPQLVEAMTRSPDAAAVVRAMMGLARQLDIEIVAEGVETEAQCAFLLAESAAAAQGFLFGRPVPAQQAGELLRQGAIRPPGAGIAA